MARFSIIANGNPQTVRFEGAPVYNGTYLKPSYIEFREIASPTPIEWEVGDYVDYTRTGLRYKIYSKPQVKKQARRNSYGGAFVYQNVQLFDRTKDFDICPFRDLVPEDNNIHFSTQPSISTYEDVGGIARRIQACLDDMFGDWEVRVVSSSAEADAEFMAMISEPRDFTVSGVSVLGALDKIYEVWPLCGWTYSVEGSTNVLTIGGANIASAKNAAQSFLYGKGNGLKDIKKTYTNANEIATRIYAYGSTRNMIPRYYNNLSGIKDAESVDIINLMLPVGPVGSSYSGWGMTDNERDAKKAYIENAAAIADMGLRPTTVYFDGSGDNPEIYPTISETTIADLRNVMSSSAQYYPSSSWDGTTRLDQIISAGNVDDGSQGSSGEKYVKTSSSEFYSFGASLGDGGTASLASLVADDEIAGTASFTTTIAGTVTISYGDREPVISLYARIQGTGGQVERSVKVNLTKTSDTQYSFEVPGISASSEAVGSITIYLAVSLGGQIASRSSHSAETPTFFISANGGYTLGLQKDIQKKFTVKIPQVGFNIDVQAALGAGKSISFKTGMCAGRTFDIDTCTYNATDDTWTLSVWRGEDSSLGTWFPNTDFPVAAGDQFVLLDIAMPELYIELASLRLLAKAQELLEYTSALQPFYEPDIDPKFMVENSRSIKQGQYMALEDEDIIGGTEVVLIDSLTINEGESAIPTYKVTLRERKKKTWTQSVNSSIEQNSVKSGSNTSKASTAGVTEEQILEMMFFEQDGNGGVKLKSQYVGLWASGWISAGGRSETGGGGGSDVNVARTWQSINTGDETQALGSNLGKELHDTLATVTSTYATQTWVTSQINTAITSAIKYKGTTTTALSDGSTTNPITINGSSYTAQSGDVVLYGGKEYLWDGSKWEQLGDEESWALKTVTISAGTGLTGGGNLTANRTISLSSATIASLALADTAVQPAALNNYQPKDADLTAIAELAGTSGFLKKTAANTWTLDTNTYARLYSYNLATVSSVNITFPTGMYHAMIIARYTQTMEPLILIGAGYGDASSRNRFKQINTETVLVRWRYISGEGVQIINTSTQTATISVLVTYGGAPTFTAATYDTTSAFEDYRLATFAQLSNGSVTKVGTATVGGTAKPIYLNAGTPTAFSSTIGSSERPVYVNAGTITQVSTINGNLISGRIADSSAAYLVSHPERTTTGVLVPFLNNDIAFLVQQGGHVTIYSTTETDLTKETLAVKHLWGSDSTYGSMFDGSPSYYNFGNDTAAEMAADGIIIDITLPRSFQHGNRFYIDFGAGWGFDSIKVFVKNSTYETAFTNKVSNTSTSNRYLFYSSLSHSIVDGGGTTRYGFDMMRIYLYDSPSTTGGRRIAQIGLLNFGSQGNRYVSMSRGYNDRVWRSISPFTTNTYSLGESSYRWSNVYSVLGNFSGAVTASSTLSVGGNLTVGSTSAAKVSTFYGTATISKAVSNADYDALTIANRGSWSSAVGKIAGVNVTDGTGTVGKFGIGYDGVGFFAVRSLYKSGSYGSTGDVFRVDPSYTSVYGTLKLAGTTKKIWFGDTYFIELNSSNQLHTNAPFFSDSWVSAGGASSTSGGGGGGSDVTVLRSWPANPNDQYEALGSNLGQGLKNSVDGLDTRVTALEQSATSVSITNTLSTGTRIATVTIDNVSTDIKAPIPDMSGYVSTTALSTWAGSQNITTLGTITTGTWNANTIGVTKGGTGLTSIAKGAILYASGANALSPLSANGTSTKKFLSQTSDNAPAWSTLAASDIPSLDWSKINSGKPTSLSGYGIVDAKIESVTNGTKVTLGSNTLTIPTWATGASENPSMYVGTTQIQSSSAAQALTGISSITATSSASSQIVWDDQNNAWHFIGNVYADGFISAGGLSDTAAPRDLETITSRQDGTIDFSFTDGDTITVDLNHVHPQYPRYVLLADEAAYNALVTTDADTLYLIPESSS